jgi:hypothetical protein
MDLRSLPKRWNDTARLRDIAVLPEYSQSRPWPLLGMLAFGLVVGAAVGGYAVSQRSQMKRLAKHVRHMAEGLEGDDDLADEPVVTSQRTNHRRKASSEV